MSQAVQRFVRICIVALFGAAACASACRREPAAGARAPQTPTVRLYVLSAVAGALDPCGCTKDQLGGVDHAAALLRAGAKEAPHSLVLAAGPTLFLNPKAEPDKATQDLWKAEALARSLGEMGLAAWSPGANDWAAGGDDFARLAKETRAEVLAGNLGGASAGARTTRIVEVNGQRVGIAGISDPSSSFGPPPGVEVKEPRAALEAAKAELQKAGATVKVALVAVDRGRAMRLAEQVPGFDVLVVGKSFDQGEGNDPVFPPALVDKTLVVQGRNHLQAVAVVDLFVRGTGPFKDGTGVEVLEKRQALGSRIEEMERRVAASRTSGASEADLTALRAELARQKQELAGLKDPAAPAEGNYFRVSVQEVNEKAGSDPSVAAKMADYYRRVNDHNKEAFKDREPKKAVPGAASYIGAEECQNCHGEAYTFWKGTPHGRAYETLSKQHKEFNLDCVSCHVTGYEKPGGSTVTHVSGLMDVQCEVCHGPGSLHEKNPEDLASLVRSPPKTLCGPACHHPPHVSEAWRVEEAWPHIFGKGHGEARLKK
jgi:2',3'-cyclic-nucleotide 2'-phosphodiesterase (5'-nucleotidase family)